MNKKFKHKYKALLLDVDGTIVINGGGTKISKKVKDSIIKSKKKISVGIVSGRPLEQLIDIFDDLELQLPCVISGGAQIIHPVTKEILWEKPILQKDIETIVTLLKPLDLKIWVVTEGKEILFTKDLKFGKTLSFFISKITEDAAVEIISRLGMIPTLTHTKIVAYHQGYIGLHITHAEATKEYAAVKLAEFLEVSNDDIIGIGDGYNDYSLFKACGLRVAVDNAVPELKNKADYIAPSVYEDGVAHVIEKFIFNQYLTQATV